jgi:hypothetical protein
MTRSHGVVRGSMRSGRWLLPWILVLVGSATFAYTMNSAVTGALANPDGRLQVAIAPTVVDLPCTSLFGSYNWWLFTSGRRGPCGMEEEVARDTP